MDLLLDEDNDLTIDSGDFVIDDDTQQRVELFLRAQQGHFKQFPLAGCGLPTMIAGALTPALKRQIQLQLESDGLKVGNIRQSNENLQIDLR